MFWAVNRFDYYAKYLILSFLCLLSGPLYFTFMIGTKMFYFAQTILVGGAKYRPTGRGFVITYGFFCIFVVFICYVYQIQYCN